MFHTTCAKSSSEDNVRPKILSYHVLMKGKQNDKPDQAGYAIPNN